MGIIFRGVRIDVCPPSSKPEGIPGAQPEDRHGQKDISTIGLSVPINGKYGTLIHCRRNKDAFGPGARSPAFLSARVSARGSLDLSIASHGNGGIHTTFRH